MPAGFRRLHQENHAYEWPDGRYQGISSPSLPSPWQCDCGPCVALRGSDQSTRLFSEPANGTAPAQSGYRQSWIESLSYLPEGNLWYFDLALARTSCPTLVGTD